MIFTFSINLLLPSISTSRFLESLGLDSDGENDDDYANEALNATGPKQSEEQNIVNETIKDNTEVEGSEASALNDGNKGVEKQATEVKKQNHADEQVAGVRKSNSKAEEQADPKNQNHRGDDQAPDDAMKSKEKAKKESQQIAKDTETVKVDADLSPDEDDVRLELYYTLTFNILEFC